MSRTFTGHHGFLCVGFVLVGYDNFSPITDCGTDETAEVELPAVDDVQVIIVICNIYLSCLLLYQSKKSNLNLYVANMLQANWRHMVAETSQSVYCVCDIELFGHYCTSE